MSEKWYFNETLMGLKPANDVRFDIGFVTREQRCIGIVLPSSFHGMMYDVESVNDILAFLTSWEDPAYRTIELDEPATGELLTFLQQNATNLSSGTVDPNPPVQKLINKVVLGSDTVLDLTSDTVTPETLLVGTTAHNAKGETITGTLVPCTVYSAESPAATTSNSAQTFTWEIPSTEHGFKSKNLVVSVYLSTGEQIQCDVTISDTFTVTLTAVYSSDIVTIAGDVPIPAGYLRAVIIGPVETPAAVQQAMLNELPVYTGGGNY